MNGCSSSLNGGARMVKPDCQQDPAHPATGINAMTVVLTQLNGSIDNNPQIISLHYALMDLIRPR